jgi:hypothetical protein
MDHQTDHHSIVNATLMGKSSVAGPVDLPAWERLTPFDEPDSALTDSAVLFSNERHFGDLVSDAAIDSLRESVLPVVGFNDLCSST